MLWVVPDEGNLSRVHVQSRGLNHSLELVLGLLL